MHIKYDTRLIPTQWPDMFSWGILLCLFLWHFFIPNFWGGPSVNSFLIPAVMMFNLELPTSDLAVPRHRVRKTKLFSISESCPPPALELMLSSLVNPKLFSTLASSLLSPGIAEQLLMVKIHVRVQSSNYLCPMQTLIYFSFPFLSLSFPPPKVNYGVFLSFCVWNVYLKELFFF